MEDAIEISYYHEPGTHQLSYSAQRTTQISLVVSPAIKIKGGKEMSQTP